MPCNSRYVGHEYLSWKEVRCKQLLVDWCEQSWFGEDDWMPTQVSRYAGCEEFIRVDEDKTIYDFEILDEVP